MSQLKFQPLNLNGRILVIFERNNSNLGDLIKLEDGYYQWFPTEDATKGFWSAYILREIADKLDELNDAWDQEVKSVLREILVDHVTQSLSDQLHGDDDTGIEWPG